MIDIQCDPDAVDGALFALQVKARTRDLDRVFSEYMDCRGCHVEFGFGGQCQLACRTDSQIPSSPVLVCKRLRQAAAGFGEGVLLRFRPGIGHIGTYCLVAEYCGIPPIQPQPYRG